MYLTKDKKIIQSREKDYYNTAYSDEGTFSGFKPYSDKTDDYKGAPDIVWTEGTLGYSTLAYVLGNMDEAKKYVDECIRMQNCDGSTGGVIYTTATYGMLPWYHRHGCILSLIIPMFFLQEHSDRSIIWLR